MLWQSAISESDAFIPKRWNVFVNRGCTTLPSAIIFPIDLIKFYVYILEYFIMGFFALFALLPFYWSWSNSGWYTKSKGNWKPRSSGINLRENLWDYINKKIQGHTVSSKARMPENTIWLTCIFSRIHIKQTWNDYNKQWAT